MYESNDADPSGLSQVYLIWLFSERSYSLDIVAFATDNSSLSLVFYAYESVLNFRASM